MYKILTVVFWISILFEFWSIATTVSMYAKAGRGIGPPEIVGIFLGALIIPGIIYFLRHLAKPNDVEIDEEEKH